MVYAGNIGLMQNVEIVIRAAAQMKDEKDICFHVIGDGMYRKKLEQMAIDLQADNVAFHDMMGSDCASAIYSAADVNVIPLAKDIYRTALPSKTATCLACGKPIVFAIGKESKFGQQVHDQIAARVIASDDVMGLCAAINKVKRSSGNMKNQAFFMKGFAKTENSSQYAKIITQ